jgi:hypothetical protein
MSQLSWNMGASTSWNPQGLSRTVMGLLYRFYSAEKQSRWSLSCPANSYVCSVERLCTTLTLPASASFYMFTWSRLGHAVNTNVASNNRVMIFHSDKRFGLLAIGQRMVGNNLEMWGILWPVYAHCVRYWISWFIIVGYCLPLCGNRLFINVFKMSFDWDALIKSVQ